MWHKKANTRLCKVIDVTGLDVAAYLMMDWDRLLSME